MDDRRNQCGGRFVILRHEMPPTAERGSHWDLMLENRGILLTWELPQLDFLSLPATFSHLGIRRLANHRLHYLEYEGPVSGDRGAVSRIDTGRYSLVNAETHETKNDFIQVIAIGRNYQIEAVLPKAIFVQTGDLHLRSDSGELRAFRRLV